MKSSTTNPLEDLDPLLMQYIIEYVIVMKQKKVYASGFCYKK